MLWAGWAVWPAHWTGSHWERLGAGSQLCLNSPLSSLEALGCEGSSGSFNHHEHFIFYRCHTGARHNWWSARDGPEFLLTLLWPLSVGLSEEWFGFYGQNGQNQKVTHTFPFAKFSQLSSHDIQSLLVAFPAPVLYKYHKIENKLDLRYYNVKLR